MVFENSLAAYEGARLMDKNKDLRKLPLSHLVYLNNKVDADKANKFVVYHYPLLNNSLVSMWLYKAQVIFLRLL